MPEPWRTAEWKKKRASLLEGKKCEWCGSSENLCVHHPKRYLSYKAWYQLASSILLRELIAKGIYKSLSQDACPKCRSLSIYSRKTVLPKYRCIRCKAEFDEPIELSTGWLSKEDFADFHSRYKEEINAIVKAKRQKAYQEYVSLEGVTILCKACHLAAGKGMVLCKKCRKKYHKPDYSMCWDCFSKTHRGKEVIRENEILSYTHPWCGKVFSIERKWWEIEAIPQMCCIEHCNIDNHSCDIAKKNWLSLESDS